MHGRRRKGETNFKDEKIQSRAIIIAFREKNKLVGTEKQNFKATIRVVHSLSNTPERVPGPSPMEIGSPKTTGFYQALSFHREIYWMTRHIQLTFGQDVRRS